MLSIEGERNRVAEGDRRERFPLDLSYSMTRLAEAACGLAYRCVFGICFCGVPGSSKWLLLLEELVFIADRFRRESGVMIRFTPTLRGVPGARYAMTKPDLVVL